MNETPYKSEFYKGEAFALSGASRIHNVIYVKLTSFLFTRLKGQRMQTVFKRCAVVISTESTLQPTLILLLLVVRKNFSIIKLTHF
jgi:hypothetical protein